jgi:trypsin
MSDRMRELVDELAREVAGDDPRAYTETTVALLNVAGDIAEAPGEDRAAAALEHLARHRPVAARGRRRLRSAAAVAPVGSTLYADPVYQANLPYVLRNRRRIVGGRPTTDFPDCVAVGSSDTWCCSGFLVASNVVVTAAHCAGQCSDRVLVGDSTESDGGGRVVEVAEVRKRDDYVKGGPNDLALLILREDVPGVEPRAIASAAALAEARTVRLVGFGTTDQYAVGGYGTKRAVDVPIASSDPVFGATPEREFVAGKPLLDRDSCKGDSGGPAYIETNNGWLVAGVTSRQTKDSCRPCGDGGIYARLHVFEDWIKGAPGVH